MAVAVAIAVTLTADGFAGAHGIHFGNCHNRLRVGLAGGYHHRGRWKAMQVLSRDAFGAAVAQLSLAQICDELWHASPSFSLSLFLTPSLFALLSLDVCLRLFGCFSSRFFACFFFCLFVVVVVFCLL